MLTDIHNSPDMPILRMRGINKTYPGETPLHVLKGVDLDIHQGELVSIMGASGSGKSTLLNVIGILDTYDEGTTIAKVADLSDIVFNGEIDEIQVGKLHTGMTVTLVPGAMQNISIPAVLEYISPEGKLVNGTRKFEVKAAADIPAGISIRSGYSVNASIQLERAAGAMSVDEVCIAFEDDQPYVYRLTSADDNVQDQKWERIPVTLGISDGLYIEVKSGITADMKLRGKKK